MLMYGFYLSYLMALKNVLRKCCFYTQTADNFKSVPF